MHLVQIQNQTERRVAVVREPELVVLREVDSTLALAERALREGRKLSELAADLATGQSLSYDALYEGRSDWKLLSPIDCRENPHRIHVSGTGLTHLGSARDRQAMHVAATAKEQAQMTDSMRMFEWGRQKGRPPEGEIGVARSGSTRAMVRLFSLLSDRFPFPATPKMVERKPRWPQSI